MPATLLESIDQRLADCRDRIERMRRLVSTYPEWSELPRVLHLAEESLRDLEAHRRVVEQLQSKGAGGAGTR